MSHEGAFLALVDDCEGSRCILTWHVRQTIMVLLSAFRATWQHAPQWQ